MARRKKIIKKKDNTFNKYIILFALSALFIVFFVLPNIKIISIVVCVVFGLSVIGYWRIPKFREAVNVKVFHRQPKEEDEEAEEEVMRIEKPNGKRIVEATVMPLDLDKVKTADLIKELSRRGQIKG